MQIESIPLTPTLSPLSRGEGVLTESMQLAPLPAIAGRGSFE
jgi:hypothetical protein